MRSICDQYGIKKAVHRAIYPIQNIGAPDPEGPPGAPKGVFLGPLKGEGKGK